MKTSGRQPRRAWLAVVRLNQPIGGIVVGASTTAAVTAAQIVAALPSIIEGLRARGYTFVSLCA